MFKETSSVLHGCGTWAMMAKRERKLRATKRKMMRNMLGAQRKRGVGGVVVGDAERAEAQHDKSPSNTSSTSSARSNSRTSSSTNTKDTGTDDEDEEADEDGEAEGVESWAEWIV